MTTQSVKDSVKQIGAVLSVAVVIASFAASPLLSQPTVNAASATGWKLASTCLKESKQSSDDTYFSRCVNQQSVEGMVYRAYRVVLGRQPDVNGFNYLSKVGAVSIHQDPTKVIVATMMRSSEYRNKVMTENTQSFVADTYKRAFGVAGDAAGINYWTSRINSIQANHLTQQQFLQIFVQTNRTKTTWSLEAPCFITGYNAQYCAN